MALEGRERAEMPFHLLWELRHADVLPDDPRFFDLMADALIRFEPRDIRTQVFLLVKLDPKRAVDPLVETLKRKDLKEDARDAVVTALGDTHDERALAPLLAALPDSKGYVRRGFVRAIGGVRTPASREAILRLIENPDEEAGYEAWEAVKDWRDPRIIPLFAKSRWPRLAGAGHGCPGGPGTGGGRTAP